MVSYYQYIIMKGERLMLGMDMTDSTYYTILSIGISLVLPFIAWVILRCTKLVSGIPYFAGLLAFIILLLPRAVVGYMVSPEDLGRSTTWLYHLSRGVIFGAVEELARYYIFCKIMWKRDTWKDCMAYGLGHGFTELVLIHEITAGVFSDKFMMGFDFLIGTGFSMAMTVFVFNAEHFAKSRKYLAAAIFCHFLIDFLPAFCYAGIVTPKELIYLYCGAVFLMAGGAYLVYWSYKDSY